MKSKECLNMLMDKIKNNQPLVLDLKNGVILNLNYDIKIKSYRGLWKEYDMLVGIWEKETLLKILSGEINNVELVI